MRPVSQSFELPAGWPCGGSPVVARPNACVDQWCNPPRELVEKGDYCSGSSAAPSVAGPMQPAIRSAHLCARRASRTAGLIKEQSKKQVE